MSRCSPGFALPSGRPLMNSATRLLLHVVERRRLLPASVAGRQRVVDLFRRHLAERGRRRRAIDGRVAVALAHCVWNVAKPLSVPAANAGGGACANGLRSSMRQSRRARRWLREDNGDEVDAMSRIHGCSAPHLTCDNVVDPGRQPGVCTARPQGVHCGIMRPSEELHGETDSQRKTAAHTTAIRTCRCSGISATTCA